MNLEVPLGCKPCSTENSFNGRVWVKMCAIGIALNLVFRSAFALDGFPLITADVKTTDWRGIFRISTSRAFLPSEHFQASQHGGVAKM